MQAVPITADRVFHAMGDPTRRAIIARLGHGPMSVSRLAEPLGVSLTAVSQHVQVLQDSGLVTSEKQGRVRTCRVATAGLSVLEQWISFQRNLWQDRLDRLGDVLAEPDDPNLYDSHKD